MLFAVAAIIIITISIIGFVIIKTNDCAFSSCRCNANAD